MNAGMPNLLLMLSLLVICAGAGASINFGTAMRRNASFGVPHDRAKVGA